MEGHQNGQEMEHSPCEEKLRNQGWLSLGLRWLQEDLTAASKHLWEGQQEDWVLQSRAWWENEVMGRS